MNQWISDGITIAGMIAIIGFLWNLRNDMHREISGLRTDVHRQISELRDHIGKLEADMRERMARLEGLFEGFTNRKESS